MTWTQALRIADRQIAQWQRDGIGPASALMALHDEQPTRWPQVRQQLAAWVLLHKDRWED